LEPNHTIADAFSDDLRNMRQELDRHTKSEVLSPLPVHIQGWKVSIWAAMSNDKKNQVPELSSK
jgi:hypothetical protein